LVKLKTYWGFVKVMVVFAGLVWCFWTKLLCVWLI